MKTLRPKELEANKGNKSDDKEKLLKYREIFGELPNEEIGEIYNIGKQIDFTNLIILRTKVLVQLTLLALEIQFIFIII